MRNSTAWVDRRPTLTSFAAPSEVDCLAWPGGMPSRTCATIRAPPAGHRIHPLMLLRFLAFLAVLVLLAAAYFWAALSWSYSSGERAGFVQKISHKGWVCKTWEGELALLPVPGTMAAEKFLFTVRDDAVARQIQEAMSKRLTLHYEEKVGLPTTCFGDTRYFVTRVTATADLPGGAPAPGGPAPAAATTPPAASAAPASAAASK